MHSFVAYAVSKDVDAYRFPGSRTNDPVNWIRGDSLLTDYTGTFDFADFPSLDIYLHNGDLYGSTSQGKSILKRLKQQDSFEIVDYQATLHFKRNSDGTVVSVELDAHGFTSTGNKRKSTD